MDGRDKPGHDDPGEHFETVYTGREMTMYRSLPIWKRLNSTECVRYSCLENVETGEFCVPSSDFFHLPVHPDSMVQVNKQFIELLIEIDPKQRGQWFASLKEAIVAHEMYFS